MYHLSFPSPVENICRTGFLPPSFSTHLKENFVSMATALISAFAPCTSVAVSASSRQCGSVGNLAVWETSFTGYGVSALNSRSVNVSSTGSCTRSQIRMGNKNEGKGIFAPIVVVVRSAVGQKQFNQLRGKGIALHSQVSCCRTAISFSQW